MTNVITSNGSTPESRENKRQEEIELLLENLRTEKRKKHPERQEITHISKTEWESKSYLDRIALKESNNVAFKNALNDNFKGEK